MHVSRQNSSDSIPRKRVYIPFLIIITYVGKMGRYFAIRAGCCQTVATKVDGRSKGSLEAVSANALELDNCFPTYHTVNNRMLSKKDNLARSTDKPLIFGLRTLSLDAGLAKGKLLGSLVDHSGNAHKVVGSQRNSIGI